MFEFMFKVAQGICFGILFLVLLTFIGGIFDGRK
jgi:hypothetical protein